MRILRWIKISGVWVSIPILFIGVISLHNLHPNKPISAEEWFILLILAIVAIVYIWSTNAFRLKNGKREEDISITDVFNYTPESYDESDGKEKFSHPPIDTDYLFDSPFDAFYVIGTTVVNGKKKYVGLNSNMKLARHILVSGGSGAGKSSTAVIPAQINMIQHNRTHLDKCYGLIIDAKGEQWEAVGSKCPGEAIKIDVSDPLNSYGYNPLYQLSENSDDKTLFETCNMITLSIIPNQSVKSGNDGPWNSLSQQMLCGCMMYAVKYLKMKYLPQIIRWMLSKSMEVAIKEACEDMEQKLAQNSLAYMQLIQFTSMSPETLYSVVATLQPKILSFTETDTEKLMQYAKRWFTFDDLKNKSVYLVMPLNKMQQNAPFVFLLINQLAMWLFSLSPEEVKQKGETALIFDEVVAICQALGSIPERLPSLLMYGRSFGFHCIMAVQSIDGLRCIMSNEETNNFISNIPTKIFLDCSMNSEDLVKWVGKYPRKHTTYNGIGKDRTKTIQFNDEDILTQSEAQALGMSEELIVLYPRYARIKKNPWYLDTNYYDKL